MPPKLSFLPLFIFIFTFPINRSLKAILTQLKIKISPSYFLIFIKKMAIDGFPVVAKQNTGKRPFFPVPYLSPLDIIKRDERKTIVLSCFLYITFSFNSIKIIYKLSSVCVFLKISKTIKRTLYSF